MIGEHRIPDEAKGIIVPSPINLGENAKISDRTDNLSPLSGASRELAAPIDRQSQTKKPKINFAFAGIDRGVARVSIDTSQVGTPDVPTVVDALVQQHSGSADYYKQGENTDYSAKDPRERPRSIFPNIHIGLTPSRWSDGVVTHWANMTPEKNWIAGVYAAQITPTAPERGKARFSLEVSSFHELQRASQLLAGTVMDGEHSRVVQFVEPPVPEENDMNQANNNRWLQTLADGGIPLVRFSTNPEDATEYDYYSHDYDFHLVNFSFFPREVNDAITEAATHSLMDRENNKDEDGVSPSSGILIIDALSDNAGYSDLLSYLIAHPEKSCEERLATLREGVGFDSIDPLLQVQAEQGIGLLVRDMRQITEFNTKHREGREATKEEKEAAVAGMFEGVVRVAKKIRGEYADPQENSELVNI